ncbi:MAG: hypothetical protein E6713_01770 [Sporomusaceae bacterium]|nr:hypothetical protein [Sporomusaceae bacterium]
MKQGLVLTVFIVAFAAFLASPSPILRAHGTATMQNHDHKVMIIQVPKSTASDDFQIVSP